jgi:tRNA threonylcarbamoyladenosine biosynthesis protein TsaB
MLLAVDTSTAQIGLSLYDGVLVRAESMWQSQQHHTMELAPAVSDLMRHAGVTVGELKCIGVAIGPGSFTALRVGLAFVKGLALSRKLPIAGVPTLNILAAGQPASKLTLIGVLQAGRGRIAAARYRFGRDKAFGEASWQLHSPAEITTVDALADTIEKPTLVAGELSAAERQRLARKKVNVLLAPPWLCVRRPSVLAQLAWKLLQDGQVEDPASLAPVYLQLPQPVAT